MNYVPDRKTYKQHKETEITKQILIIIKEQIKEAWKTINQFRVEIS